MGNCLPKLKKKNKVCPDTSVSGKKRKRTKVSTSVESLIMEKEATTLDELKETDPTPEVKKPVFFQVDFVQGMPFRMPSRLAERMGQNTKQEVKPPVQQMTLTEDDELLMNDIMNEFEAKERLEKLEEQQMAAQTLREMRLDAIREKARGMRSRPQTRAGDYTDGGYGGGGRDGRG